jgi:hypothetical protein
VFAQACTIIVELTRSREEIAGVLVKRYCHDTIRMVKGELNAVSMMNVDIYVENPGVISI